MNNILAFILKQAPIFHDDDDSKQSQINRHLKPSFWF